MAPNDIDERELPDSPLLVDDTKAEASGNVLLLPPSVERELNNNDESLGVLGRPFNQRNPFFVGLTGALGVAAAYVIAKGIADITSVLTKGLPVGIATPPSTSSTASSRTIW